MTPADRSHHEPNILAEENIRAVARIQQEAAQRRTFAQRVSDRVSSFASRESTVVWHVVWFTIWIVANVGLLPLRPFDPFPFSLLTTFVSLEAIFLTLFVLASQNRLKQEADRRAHLDLQVNLLAEQKEARSARHPPAGARAPQAPKPQPRRRLRPLNAQPD